MNYKGIGYVILLEEIKIMKARAAHKSTKQRLSVLMCCTKTYVKYTFAENHREANYSHKRGSIKNLFPIILAFLFTTLPNNSIFLNL